MALNAVIEKYKIEVPSNGEPYRLWYVIQNELYKPTDFES